MPINNAIGQLFMIPNKVPRRHFGRELSAITELSNFAFGVGKMDDADQKVERCEHIFLQLIWSEGEKLISLIEDTLSPSTEYPERRFPTSEPGIPVSRAVVEHLVNALASEEQSGERQKHVLTSTDSSGGFAFDLILYDKELKRLRYIHLYYGLGHNREAMDAWRTEKAVLSGILPRLAAQYFCVEINHIEFVTIDPLLTETHVPDGIWCLQDLDLLTEIEGSAKLALEIQRRQRQMLSIWYGKILAKDETERNRQISSIITCFALEGIVRRKPPCFETLLPERI